MIEYRFLIVPFISLIICQILKTIIETIEDKNFDIRRLFNGSGGIPSSHTTFSISLTTIIALTEGISSPLFAIALVFSFVIAYDAMGVRHESEKQARVLNILTKKVQDKSLKEIILKEDIGHSFIEVVAGVGLGVTTALLYFFIFIN